MQSIPQSSGQSSMRESHRKGGNMNISNKSRKESFSIIDSLHRQSVDQSHKEFMLSGNIEDIPEVAEDQDNDVKEEELKILNNS